MNTAWRITLQGNTFLEVQVGTKHVLNMLGPDWTTAKFMQTLLWRHMTTYVVLCSLARGSRQANSKRFQSPFLAQESLEQ